MRVSFAALVVSLLPYGSSLACDPLEEFYDVVIVGAGMAGLSAGKTLLEDEVPLTFKILEAQDDRVGGRIRSNKDWFDNPKVVVEECANWFSDNTQNPTLALANQYGVDMFVQDFGNYNLYEFDEGGAELADSLERQFSSRDINQAYNCIQKEAAKLFKEEGNFLYDPLVDGVQAVQEEFCGWEEESSLNYFDDWLVHGYEFAEKDTSMYSYPNRLYSYHKFFLIMDQEEGFEKLPKSFAEEFLSLSCFDADSCESPYIAFNQVVGKIDYIAVDETHPVLIETNLDATSGCPTHRFRAKRAISTLPIGVMNKGIKDNDPPVVEFNPPLQHESVFNFADYVKVFYQFDHKFWEETDDNQFIVSIPADYQEILDTQGRCIHWQSLDYTTGKQKGPKQSSPEIAPGSNILFCTLLTEAFQLLIDEAFMTAGSDELTDTQLDNLLEPLRKVFGNVGSYTVNYSKLYKNPYFYGSYENWDVGYNLIDYYNYHGGILPGSDPLIVSCKNGGDHNGCHNGKWLLHISGSSSCRAYYGFVRGAFDGGKRSANYVRADIGCGGGGCDDVDTMSVCDDLFVNNGNNDRHLRTWKM